MQTRCDIYLIEILIGSSKLLKQLRIFAPDLELHDDRQYFGFLGLNLPRMKAVAIAIHLKNNGIKCFNVPIRYRDEKLLSVESAALVAADKVGGHLLIDGQAIVRPNDERNPMYWSFRTVSSAERDIREGGGIVTVDALDGHFWDGEEMEAYMYDYNNVL